MSFRGFRNEDDYWDAKREAALEERSYKYKYNCGGFRNYSGPCGAPDCGSCRNGAPWEEEEEEEAEAVTATYLIASREYRGGIKKGDLYVRWSGFTYEEGGARTGYLPTRRGLVSRPPGTEGHHEMLWERGMAVRAHQLKVRRTGYTIHTRDNDVLLDNLGAP